MPKLATKLRAGRRRAQREHQQQVWRWQVVAFERRLRHRLPDEGTSLVGQYVLVDGQPYRIHPDELLLWAMWLETANNRVVAQTKVKDKVVSTVFLGLDHAFGGGPPVLWETMVFFPDPEADADWHRFQRRYRSREEAEIGHWETVDEVKNGIILLLDETEGEM